MVAASSSGRTGLVTGYSPHLFDLPHTRPPAMPSPLEIVRGGVKAVKRSTMKSRSG